MSREPLHVPGEAPVRSPWIAPGGAIPAVRRWLVVAPYIRSETGAWLHHFVDPRFGFQFETVPVRQAHATRRRRTNALEWLTFAEQANRAWRQAHAGAQPAGIVTVFPPLAALVALRKRLSGSRLPLVAWTFNVNALHGGMRGELARYALSAVDRLIVHSTAEVASYEAWLKLPPGRAQFVPLQQVLRDIEFAEETRSPFVLAMGSANRDYATFARAMAIAGMRGVVVAEPHALEGVTFPPNVEVRTGLSHQACNALVQEARVLAVPVASESTASGQVALLTGMMYGRPVVATRCTGTEDYVHDGDDGMLVPRGDADAMAQCLLALWRSQTQRESIGARARTRIAEAHSDEAIGAVLAGVLAGIGGEVEPADRRGEPQRDGSGKRPSR